jgi:hypothetical protein
MIEFRKKPLKDKDKLLAKRWGLILILSPLIMMVPLHSERSLVRLFFIDLIKYKVPPRPCFLYAKFVGDLFGSENLNLFFERRIGC